MSAQYPKPQKGNPHQLTIRQHIIPARSIERFYNDKEKVNVYDLQRKITRFAKKDDALFCVMRHWDQRAESVYMKKIEDAYQNIAEKSGLLQGMLNSEDSKAVSRYYALLLSRMEIARLPNTAIKVNGVISRGRELSLDEEERLEKNGIGYMSNDLTWPARQIYGMKIFRKIDEYMEVQMRDIKSWGCCHAPPGSEFILPDYALCSVIAISPTRAFVANVCRRLAESEVFDFNREAFHTSERFVAARDFNMTGLPIALEDNSFRP